MTVQLMIEKLGAHGDGIGYFEGKEIFAPFTVPGERIEGQIEQGRIETPRIVDPVAHRIKAPCRYFKRCGGCSTQHIAPGYLANWKQELVADALNKQGLESVFHPVQTSKPNSRRRAVFTGKRTKADAMLGLHARRSSEVIQIDECALLDPAISAGFEGLVALVKLAATRKSEVRVSVTNSLGGLDIDLSNAKPVDAAMREMAVKIVHDHQFCRLFWNDELVLERQPAHQSFGGIKVIPPNNAFLQATPDGEAAIWRAVSEIVGPAKSVVDLFAGCGTFALPLARTAEVVAAESDQAMLDALHKGWRNAIGLKRIQTLQRDLFRNPMRADELNAFEAIVIDPPRAGAREQTQQIALSGVKTIAFVSCNPATFARDARHLVDGGYMLRWVRVIDQFLWSGHCELIAKFTRA
jgi:23S rRNA (uracil1939-C5)-methyltransferase